MFETLFGPAAPTDRGAGPTRPPRRGRIGLAAYYRDLEAAAEGFALPADDCPWFDWWHVHPDWQGDGNRSPADRVRHLRAGLQMLDRAATEAGCWSIPMQVWMIVDPFDSAEDAVYAHTANPNRENFPFDFAGVDWEAAMPTVLESLLDRWRYAFGRSDEGGTAFWIRPRPTSSGPSR